MSDNMVKRRTVLGAIGAGALAPFTRTATAGKIERSTRIVAGRSGESHEPIFTKTVPKRWLKHQQAVREVTKRLDRAYSQRDYVGTTSYVASSRMRGGVRFSQPEIAVIPGTSQSMKEQLPDSVKAADIKGSSNLVVSDIKTREMNGDFIAQNVDCYRNVTDSTFPGGLEIHDSDSSALGTAGFKVWKNGNEYMYTANHVLNDGSCAIADAGMDDANNNLLGYTVDGHKTHDWITVSDASTTYDNTIQYDEGEITIDGYATQNGMESIQGEKGTLQFQGIVSGYQDAYVKGGGASAVAGCIKMFGSATKIGMSDYARDGDSGGPYWWPTSEGDLVVGVHSIGEDSGSYSGCGLSGDKARPCYTYPFWRVANNTNYTVKDV